MAPRRLPWLNSLVWPEPFSDCIMTPNRALTRFLFSFWLNKLSLYCAEVRADTGASARMIYTYEAQLNDSIWILKRAPCSSSCSYAYLAANKANLASAPATHCTHDLTDMDPYLSSDAMTMSLATVTPAFSPLSKEKGLYSAANFTLSLGPGVPLCAREWPILSGCLKKAAVSIMLWQHFML